MKILLSHKPENRISGGWSFENYFIKGMKSFLDVQIVYEFEKDIDIYFMPMITSVKNPEWIDMAKELGKKVVVRVGNMPHPSRNRRYGVFEKLKNFTTKADQVVYQSKWAKDFIAWGEIPDKGQIIINGVDTSVFNKNGVRRNFRDEEGVEDVYLILISSSDPCKRLHESLDIYSRRWKEYLLGKKGKCKLIIAGRLPDEYHVIKSKNNWDFVRGENVEYIGELKPGEEVAAVMRGCTNFLFPSYNDACPNTVLEAKACGLDIDYSFSGGTPECIGLPEYKLGLIRMCKEYYDLFNNLLKKQW